MPPRQVRVLINLVIGVLSALSTGVALAGDASLVTD